MILVVARANAAGHMPVLGHGVLQAVCHHRRDVRLALHFLQAIRHRRESVLAVVVVCVDDGERLVNQVFRHQHGVNRTIGLRASFRRNKAVRQGIIFLIGVCHFDLLGNLVANQLAEGVRHAALDDENHLIKPCCHRVIDGILQQNFAVRADVVNLLVAAVTAAQSCCHNQKRRFHCSSSCVLSCLGMNDESSGGNPCVASGRKKTVTVRRSSFMSVQRENPSM